MGCAHPCPPLRPAPTGRRGAWVTRWLGRLALLLGVLAANEALSCLTYRLVDGRGFSFSRPSRQRHRLFPVPTLPPPVEPPRAFLPLAAVHPYLGFTYVPNSGIPMLRWEAPASDWGFTDWHNRSPVRKRGPGKVVVGILGASVASLFVSQGVDALGRELKRSPAFADKEIEFVGLAVGSFKQPQQLLALNYALALGGEFDVILNLDGLNEVAWYPHENAKQGVSRLYPLGWHNFIHDVPDPDFQRRFALFSYLIERRGEWAARFENSPLRWSVTANLFWKVCDRHIGGAIDRMIAEARHSPPQVPYRIRGPRDSGPPDDKAIAHLVDDWERCSLLIDRMCRAHGIRYYHFLQPNQYVPGSKLLSPEEYRIAFAPKHPSRPLIKRGYELMRQAGARLARQGVRFHDVSMAYARNEETFYYDVCCHINRAGAEALAWSMAQAIVQTPEPPRMDAREADPPRTAGPLGHSRPAP